MSDVSLSAQGFLSLASHNDLGVTLPAAAAGRMRSPENRSAPGEHLHVMPIMRGHNGPRIDESPSRAGRGTSRYGGADGRELVDGCAGEYGNPGDGGEFWQAWAAVVITLASHNVDGITLGQARPKGECADRKIAVRSSIYT